MSFLKTEKVSQFSILSVVISLPWFLFLEIWTLWNATYWLSGAMQFITVVVSLATAIALSTLLPKALKLPALGDLERANAGLKREISERQEVEEKLARQAEELAQPEAALRQQSAVLRSILNSIPSGVIVADENASITAFNPSAEKILDIGLPPDASQWVRQYGLFLADAATPYPADQLPLRRALQGQSTTNAEMFIRNPQCSDGMMVNCYGSLLLDADGLLKGGVVVFHDITEFKKAQLALQQAKDELELRVAERTAALSQSVELLERENREHRRTEAALESSKRQLQFITDSALVLIACCDAEYRYRFVNRRYAERFGLSPADLIGRQIPEVVGEPAFASFKEYVDVCLSGQNVEFEVVVPYEDLGTRHMHCAYVPQTDENGKPALVAVISDVTERKQAEATLRRSQEQLAGVIGSAMDAIITVDEGQRIILFNVAAERMFLCPSDEAIGQPLDRFIPQRFHAAHKRHIQDFGRVQVTRRSMGARGAIFGLRANGEEFPIEASISQLESEQKFYTVILRDITERKQMDKALQESELRFRATFNQAAVGIAHVSVDGRWLLVNQKLCDIIGYTRSELLQMTFQNITHPDDLDAELEFVRRVLSGEIQTYTMEKRYIRKDGALVWINLTVSLVRQATGEPEYFISVVEDISTRKAVEMELQASEQRYRQLADAMPQIVWTASPDGWLDYYNQRWFDYTGMTQ